MSASRDAMVERARRAALIRLLVRDRATSTELDRLYAGRRDAAAADVNRLRQDGFRIEVEPERLRLVRGAAAVGRR
jgi:biotin operon repressor